MSGLDAGESDIILGAIAEEYVQRLRAGETPDIEEYAARHPDRSSKIRKTLQTVGSLERLEPPPNSSDGGGSAPASSGSLPLSSVGEYVLERELGRGGMGVVFLARDEKLGRRVALKLLPLQATLDDRFLERFRREARAAALLQHPHIVPVYGVGEHEGLHYYAMKYVEGHALDVVVRSLRNLEKDESSGISGTCAAPGAGDAAAIANTGPATSLATRLLSRELSDSSSGTDDRTEPMAAPSRQELPGPLSGKLIYDRNVARLGMQVADALAYAHSHGILHRDIKPANLLLDADGRTWVTDFGLCHMGEGEGLTMSTDLLGTLRYLAPEKVEGRADVRSDVYELGMTLYELLTLRPAFKSKDRAALLHAVVNATPPRPRKLRPDLAHDLEAIVLKATAKLPEERYGTAAAMADDLRQFLSGRAVTASPPSAFHLLRLLIRRNRILSGTIAGFLLALFIATTLYLQGIARARAEQAQQLYIASISAAEATLADNPEVARGHLERSPEELRNWEWDHLSARLDDSLRTVERVDYGVRALDIDRERGLLAFVDLSETLHVRELGSGRRSWSYPASGRQVSVAPGGRTAVSAGTHFAKAWSLEEAPTLISTWPIPAATLGMAHDSAGERVFLGLDNGNVHCLDATLTEEEFVLTGYSSGATSLVVTRDDRFVVAGCADGNIRVTDLDTSEFRDLRGHLQPVLSIDITDDRRTIASGGEDGTVRLWDFDSGALLEAWQAHDAEVRCVRFSPTDDMLVSTSVDRTIGVFDPLARRRLRTLRGHGNVVWDIVFLSTGNLISSDEDGVLKEWDPNAAGGLLLLEGHAADVWGVAFAANARRLLSWSRDGTLRVWEAETGRDLRVLLGPQTTSWTATLSPDADMVASGHGNGGVRLWNIDRAEILQELFGPGGSGESRGGVRKVVFSPLGDRLFATDRARLLVWERRGSEYQFAFAEEIPGSHSLAVSAKGHWVAVGTVEGEVLLFEATPWRLAERRQVHTRNVHYLAFDPSTPTLLSAGNEGLVAVWRVDESGPVREIRVEPKSLPRGSTILGLGVGPEGKRFVVSTLGSGASLWDLERGEKLMALRGPGRNDYPYSAFSPSGKRVATGTSDGSIRVWDTLAVDERRASVLRATSRDVEARDLVDGLFAELSDYDLVKRALLEDDDLDGELREQALRKAHEDSGSLEGLVHRALRILRSPKGKEGAYRPPLIHGADLRVLRLYGESHLRQGEAEKALAYLEGIVQAGEKSGEVDVEARILLAMTYAKLGRLLEAQEMLAPAHYQVGEDEVELSALLREAESTLSIEADRQG